MFFFCKVFSVVQHFKLFRNLGMLSIEERVPSLGWGDSPRFKKKPVKQMNIRTSFSC